MKTIASPGDCLDIARLVGRVPQSVPQSPYRDANAVIELDNRIVRPEALPNLFARDHFARGFEQHSEYLERLRLKSNPAPLFPQFAPSKVHLK
jgi:hypothetical protein